MSRTVKEDDGESQRDRVVPSCGELIWGSSD